LRKEGKKKGNEENTCKKETSQIRIRILRATYIKIYKGRLLQRIILKRQTGSLCHHTPRLCTPDTTHVLGTW